MALSAVAGVAILLTLEVTKVPDELLGQSDVRVVAYVQRFGQDLSPENASNILDE
ncbi:hypothetical protein PF010_g17164 [Phytophthora fragariae]|uniref:Uncharacterized protein n=1 Tax=Phytophthora fragariae TaxID=53985 RepID=A0A6A3RNS3_9STRA|nr:hypothetical protein PF003_g38480 [Phytophthora fragariae]KAE9094286.1 hypothetical protein PF010_g17164 [Phytophthora fragariae]KAE9097469.1 hypothetical protein PF007_g16608 [Phytophthora fragariae]